MTTADLITRVIERIGHGFTITVSCVNGVPTQHSYTVRWTRHLFFGDDLVEQMVSAGTLDDALRAVLAFEDARDARLREVFGPRGNVEEMT